LMVCRTNWRSSVGCRSTHARITGSSSPQSRSPPALTPQEASSQPLSAYSGEPLAHHTQGTGHDLGLRLHPPRHASGDRARLGTPDRRSLSTMTRPGRRCHLLKEQGIGDARPSSPYYTSRAVSASRPFDMFAIPSWYDLRRIIWLRGAHRQIMPLTFIHRHRCDISRALASGTNNP
jgi:hypothetical protein